MGPSILRVFRAIPLVCALAACSSKTQEPTPAAATWSQLFSNLPGALVSVWGSSASDVWIVGGDCAAAATPQCPPNELGNGPMVLHYDGKAWTRYITGHKGALWWVQGFAGGPIYMGGENGTVLRYQAGKFEEMVTPAKTGTVFGIWGDKPDNLWAVGGAGTTASNGFIWRYDGKAWTVDPAAPPEAAAGIVFKVWGNTPADLWFVGSQGLILHGDGKTITKVASPTTQPLFTVAGTAARAYAVGGDGAIIENSGAGWQLAMKGKSQQMNGVSARGDAVFAAGRYGEVLRRDNGSWVKDETGKEVMQDFHGVWIDPAGGLWCAGGQVSDVPLISGVLLYRGTADVPGATFQTVK